MKLNKSMLLFSFGFMLAPSLALASNNAIIELESKQVKKLETTALSHIQSYLDELMQGLPEGQKLTLSNVEFGSSGASNVNVSTTLNREQALGGSKVSIDLPSVTQLSFNYALTDMNGNVLKTDSVNLRRSFSLKGYDRSPYKRYERLLTAWHKETFEI